MLIVTRYACALFLVGILSACDELTGFEKQLSQSDEWPQRLEGSFNLIDANEGDGTYATWAIGSFEPLGLDESILIEFKGGTLEEAGIDLSFDYPDPMTVWVNQEINMYFQVVRIGDGSQ